MAKNKAPREQTAEDRLFAHSVQARRKTLNWTRDDLAKRVGVTAQTVYLIESELRGVSRGEAVAIAQAFDTSVEQLTEVTAMSAVKLHQLVADVVGGLEEEFHKDVEIARAGVGEVRKLLKLAAGEIDPQEDRSPAMSRYLAEAINDAVYLVQELPTYLDSLERALEGLQELIAASEPVVPSSWAEELERSLKRASGMTEGKQ